MISPRDFLDAVAGHVEERAPQRGTRLGTVDPAYSSGKPRVTLDGTTTLSADGFTFLPSYTPVAGDRVVLLPVGSTYVVLGKPGDVPSGSSGGGGVTDHGALTGLSDNDHPQYLLVASAAELIRDTIGTALVAGTNITLTPDDVADTITINAPTNFETIRDIIGSTLVQGTGITIAVDDAANTVTISATGAGQTINQFQPLATESFTAVAGTSGTYTLSQTNYGTQLVFLNGQQLQTSEYSSPTATTVTVTPVEGPLVAGDRVVIVFAKATVLAGTYAEDIEVTTAAKGVVLKDRVNGNRYRLFMSNGVLGTELA